MKRNKRKERLKKKVRLANNHPRIAAPPKPQNSIFKLLNSCFSRFGLLIGILGVFPLYIFFKDEIHKRFAPESELYDEQHFAKGIFIPEAIDNPEAVIQLDIGTNTANYSIKSLTNGVAIEASNFLYGNRDTSDTPFGLRLLLEEDRLFIKASFYDIQKGEYVGEIKYSQWTLFKENLLNWSESDSSIEVKDRSNNIIFSMIYKKPAKIIIRGYYLERNSGSVLVISDNGVKPFPLSERSEALKEIRNIKSISNNTKPKKSGYGVIITSIIILFVITIIGFFIRKKFRKTLNHQQAKAINKP